MTDTENAISIDPIERADLDQAVEIEAQAHRYEDPDFEGQYQMPCYAWGRDDFTEMISQYRSKSKGTKDALFYVARESVETEAEGVKTVTTQVVGSLAYQRDAKGYEILLLSALTDDVRKALLGHVLKKMRASDTRKKCSFVIPDGDWATLKFVMDNELTGKSTGSGFSVKLVPNPNPEGFDGWHAEYRLATDKKKASPAAK